MGDWEVVTLEGNYASDNKYTMQLEKHAFYHMFQTKQTSASLIH